MMMAALASAAVALGQPALTKGMEGKRLDADELATARYVGVEKGMDAWVMEGRKHVKQVVLTDVNLEPVVVAPIEGSGDLELLAASPADYRTGVLLAVRWWKVPTRWWHSTSAAKMSACSGLPPRLRDATRPW